MDKTSLRQVAQSDIGIEIIKTIAWIVGGFSFIVFVALFGRLPIFRRTPIGWIHRLLLVHIPNGLIRLDNQLTGRRVTSSIARFYNYLMHDRHPVVMLTFIVLQLGGEVLFLPPASSYIPTSHVYFILPGLLVSPYIFLYLSYATEGHHITQESYESALTRYIYDYTLYHPHQSCRTCNRPKPARSKHCPICKTCMERQDHHCIWINNCVGLHNYHWFVALLIAISCLLGYGAWLGTTILDTVLQNAYVPHELVRGSGSSKKWSTALTWGEWLNVYSAAIEGNARIGAVTLLMMMTFPLALAFLVYHAYLIWAGCTTNETAKWTDLKEDIQDGLVWKARIREVKAEYPGPLDERIVYDAEHYLDQSKRRGVSPRWPKEAEWWIIRTRGGTQPTRWQVMDDGRHEEVADKRWVKVKGMKEIVNVYDLGVLANFMDNVWRVENHD